MIRDWISDHLDARFNRLSPDMQDMFLFMGQMDWLDWIVAVVGSIIVLFALTLFVGCVNEPGNGP